MQTRETNNRWVYGIWGVCDHFAEIQPCISPCMWLFVRISEPLTTNALFVKPSRLFDQHYQHKIIYRGKHTQNALTMGRWSLNHTTTNQSDVMGWASSIVRDKMQYFAPIPMLWCPCFTQRHRTQWTFYVAHGSIWGNPGFEISVSRLGPVFNCWEGGGGGKNKRTPQFV